MRLVVDSNIFVSAALKDHTGPARTVAWIARHGGLLKCSSTEAELFGVLARPKLASRISAAYVRRVREIFDLAELVAITEIVAGCRDPADDKFLGLAVNGRADLIVSGDADLLILGEFRAIPILGPSAFIDRFGPTA